MSALVEGAASLGIELSSAQLAQFDQFQAALLDWNQRLNLTRITSPERIETQHFLDSLTAAIPLLPRLRAGEAPRLVDVGAGGGFPGIPLKLAFPAVQLTLVESAGKKADFLRAMVDMLALSETSVVAERAEAAGRDPSHRDRYDWVTARAVARLPVLVELCAPFLAPGGLLVAQRRGDLDAEMLEAAPAFSALKLWARVPLKVSLAPLADGRGLVIGEKYDATPEKYPRRPGIPSKRPLIKE